MVALVFPTFRDGRAYSQARMLRERLQLSTASCAPPGEVLRDQFLFMLRAGFDAFEVKKQADADAFADDREALFGVLSADRRRQRHRVVGAMQLRNISARRPMNVTRPTLAAPDRVIRMPASTLDGALAPRLAGGYRAPPRASSVGREKLAAGVVVRHGICGAAQGARRGRSGRPGAVHRYRLAVRGDARLSRRADRAARVEGRSLVDAPTSASCQAPGSRARSVAPDPDACCALRKVAPLAQALAPFDAWINGRKRFQGGATCGDCRLSKPTGNAQIQSICRGLIAADIEAIYKLGRSAAASAGCGGLPLGRLHAVHQPHAPDDDDDGPDAGVAATRRNAASTP